MPYDLVLDGEVQELGDVKYLLSPKDLAGLRAVEALADMGVHGLKIEGRQKGPVYVATATETYRHWIDAVARESGASDDDVRRTRHDLLRTSLAYSRGFTDGFLGGSDHQSLVDGRFPKSRGVLLGRVTRVLHDEVVVEGANDRSAWTGARASDSRASAPSGVPSSALHGLGGADDASSGPVAEELEPRAGMGVVFDAGRPEDRNEPGGPIFEVHTEARGWRLRFGRPGPDLSRVAPGQLVWVNSDPRVAREVERTLAGDEPENRIALTLVVKGTAGSALELTASAAHARACATSSAVLERASSRGLDDALLREKLGALGGTPLRLEALDTAALEPGLHVPVSELKALRRTIVNELVAQIERGPRRHVESAAVAPGLRARARAVRPWSVGEGAWVPPNAPELIALCRTDEQLEAAIEAGVREVELDWMELVGLGRAVARARAARLVVTIATVRVQKPGEEGYDRRLAALDPDGVLVRHWGALVHFQGRRERENSTVRPLLHGDFSLNVTNSITAAELFERGLDTLTPSYDLDRAQLEALLEHAEPARFTLTLFHRIPTFHTEHCVYSHLLSSGRDYRTCGRPCERHEVSLRDHTQRTHPVIVDVGCRNTVFNSQAQSCARLAPALIARGVRRFRVEFVREGRAEAARILRAFSALLEGRIGPDEALRESAAKAHLGVSSAPMALMER
jgi:putative protease